MTLDSSGLDNSPASQELLQLAIDEQKRRQWLRDPVSFIKKELGEPPRPWQCKVLESVRDTRFTAAMSYHNSGRTWLAASTVLWWIQSHPPGEARVITTAPTMRQIESLWLEIRRKHADNHLSGRTNRTEWLLPVRDHEEVVALGWRPSDPYALMGLMSRYVLAVFDEVDGIPAAMWDAVNSVTAGADCRWLVVNHSDPGVLVKSSVPAWVGRLSL